MRQRSSTIWKYFDLVKTNTTEDNVYGECRHCSKTFDTRNTTSMFLHLKAKHEVEYLKALDDRKSNPIRRNKRHYVAKYRKALPEKEKNVEAEVILTKEEPMIFCEAELPINTINNISSNNGNKLTEVCRSSPVQLRLSDNNCDQANSNNISENELNANKSCKHNEVNNILPGMSLDLRFIKENILNKNNYFFLSIAAELDLLPDDAKDLIKTAIWRIIYEVKQARRSNIQLSLSNLLK
nr:uncharacterized protein LOC111413821 [Onthophagus taurus]XP_022900696.1 uncharacterized protein LOC111413821 [Onthophagus taurus]XP_022900697.1 uncharacterized protein LOC111413821 [Onthophagus taurus]XP_022900698.1 uncharacterized protein LOC111413821 [Onthophagus taurus]XP_022900700.1 uncharacterized protein LOC111413821 [Onthophagus taurus]